MDKILALIIIFLVVTFTFAGILITGAVPKIFQTEETAQETRSETQNQTEIILKQFMRENNTTNKMLVNQNKTIENQGIVINKLDQSLENQRVMLIQMNRTIVHNQQDLALNLNISKQHQQVAKDHDALQSSTSNTTSHIDKALYLYGENSVKELSEIKKNQIRILEVLNLTHSIIDQ